MPVTVIVIYVRVPGIYFEGFQALSFCWILCLLCIIIFSLPLDSSEFIYDMKHPKRGKFIIINNRTFQPGTGMNERTGTDADAYNLYNIFSKFGFEVSLHNNLTKDAMLQEMLAGIKVKNWL